MRQKTVEEWLKINFRKYKEPILYLFFGGLTTFVNILVYYSLSNICRVDYLVSNVIAWFVSVSFAFITNKFFVFESKEKKKEIVLKETISFFLCRIASLGFDMGSMYFMISILDWNQLLSKVLTNIIVIIMNYVLSKILVFRRK